MNSGGSKWALWTAALQVQHGTVEEVCGGKAERVRCLHWMYILKAEYIIIVIVVNSLHLAFKKKYTALYWNTHFFFYIAHSCFHWKVIFLHGFCISCNMTQPKLIFNLIIMHSHHPSSSDLTTYLVIDVYLVILIYLFGDTGTVVNTVVNISSVN